VGPADRVPADPELTETAGDLVLRLDSTTAGERGVTGRRGWPPCRAHGCPKSGR
jgi:hypothetical protein